jgi:hypothetical protein
MKYKSNKFITMKAWLFYISASLLYSVTNYGFTFKALFVVWLFQIVMILVLLIVFILIDNK